MTRVFTTILAGGKGERMFNLTKRRAKPSVRFAGYNLIDIMLNLCDAAGHRFIDVYTEHLSSSLLDTLRAWDREMGGFGWVKDFHTEGARMIKTRGSGDALYESQERRHDLMREYGTPDVWTVLSADHVTNLDLDKLVRKHLRKRNDVTLAVMKVPREVAAGDLGVVVTDAAGNVTGFLEKRPIDEIPSIPGQEGFCYANMANIAYDPNILDDAVTRFHDPLATSYDQSKHILTPLVAEGAHRIGVYAHDGYWSDVGQLDALFDANMDLVKIEPAFDIYHMLSATRPAFKCPGAFYSGQGVKVNRGSIMNGIAMDGTIITGRVRDSVLSYGVRVEVGAEVGESVLHDRVIVGSDARVRLVLADKNVVIGEGAVIDPAELRLDSPAYRVTDVGRGHTLIQRAWGDPELPVADNKFLPEGEMAPPVGSAHGNFAEAVLTPHGRIVMSKFSYVPPKAVFGRD